MSDPLASQLGVALIAAAFALVGQHAIGALWGVQTRRLKHLTALHRLEFALNRVYNAKITLRRQLREFKDGADRGVLLFSVPSPLPLESEMLLDLLDLQSKLRLFDFETVVKRLNRVLDDVERTYSLLRANHVSGVLPAEVFVIQARKLSEGVPELEKTLDVVDSKLLELWAWVQVRVEADSSWILRLRGRLLSVRELPEERVKVARTELEDRLERSTRQILSQEGR